MTPQEIAALVRAQAQAQGIDPEWAYRVAKAESAFNPRAVSPVGAQGVMQLMPGTARDLGVSDPFDPRANIEGGVRYMKQLSDRYGGDQVKASAAYNWGMGNVDRKGLERMPTETRNYIGKVAKDNDPYADLNPYLKKPQDNDPYADLSPYKNEPQPQQVAQAGFQPTKQRQSEAVPETLGGRVAASAGSMLTDLWLGAKQAANDSFARNKRTSLGSDWVYNKLGYDPDKTAADLRAQVAEKRQLDKPLLDSQGGTTGRILGAAGAAIPTMVLPGANTLGGAMLTGAGLGALEPITGNESRNANALLGAGGGAAGYGLGRLISGAAGGVKNLFSNASIDPQAAARIADAKSLGIDLTKGQATRNPLQWATEKNLRGTPGGEQLMERFTSQNQALIDAINKAGAGRGSGAFQTGQSAIDALAKTDAAKKAAVDSAYDFARNAAGVDTNLNAARLMNNVTNALDNAYIGDKLPTPIRNAINTAGQGGADISVGKAAQIQRAINGLYGNDPVQNKALGLVKGVIDDEIQAAGTQAGNAFQTARASAASRFKWQEAVPAAKAVAEGAASPDDFFAKYIIGGKVTDIRNTMNSLPLREKVAVQNQLLDTIKAKALNGATDEAGAFSQAAFNKQLQSLGKEKLTAILGAGRTDQLFKIGRVAESVMRQPANATVNSSNTGAAIANAAGRFAGLPIVGNNIVAPLQLAGRQMQVSQALAPNAGMYMPKPSAFNTRLAYPELLIQSGLLGSVLNTP